MENVISRFFNSGRTKINWRNEYIIKIQKSVKPPYLPPSDDICHNTYKQLKLEL